MTTSAPRSSCPICKQPATREELRPFCSSRCRAIDLGQWLGGRYRIAGEKHVDEQRLPDRDQE